MRPHTTHKHAHMIHSRIGRRRASLTRGVETEGVETGRLFQFGQGLASQLFTGLTAYNPRSLGIKLQFQRGEFSQLLVILMGSRREAADSQILQ